MMARDDFSERGRVRDAALRLRALLSEVRSAPKDSRDFALFERRDDLAKLGVDPAQIDGFDATDDAAIDRHIADCSDCLRVLGPVDDQDDDEVSVTAQVDEPSPFGDGYTTLYPRNYEPTRSSGVSAVATWPMIDAAMANRRRMAPDGSGKERVILGLPDGAGGYTVVAPKVRTRSSATADTATYTPSPGTAWGGHGHLENANGFIDAPSENRGLGDASTLKRSTPYPNFTLFNGKLGWHDQDNGRLRFTFPNGSMTRGDIARMLDNLDEEQKQFYR